MGPTGTPVNPAVAGEEAMVLSGNPVRLQHRREHVARRSRPGAVASRLLRPARKTPGEEQVPLPPYPRPGDGGLPARSGGQGASRPPAVAAPVEWLAFRRGAAILRGMAVLDGVIPVFLLVGLGTLARRLGWAGDRFVADLNRIIYWFAIPALLLRLLGRAHLGTAFSAGTVGACVAATLAAGLLALVGARGEPGPRRGVLVQAAVRGNLVYMGFPVIYAAAGPEGLTVAAVTAAVLIPFQNVLAVAALLGSARRTVREMLVLLLLNPVVLGVAGGLLWAWWGGEAWPWLDNFLRLLGNIAMPGALLAMGAQLQPEALRANGRPAAWVAVLKVAVAPAMGVALMVLLGVTGLPLVVGTLLMAAPTAVASTAVAQELGGDLDLAGACVMAASLASFPAYIAWGLILQ